MFKAIEMKLKEALVKKIEKKRRHVREIAERLLRDEIRSGASLDKIEKLIQESYYDTFTQNEINAIIEDERRKIKK